MPPPLQLPVPIALDGPALARLAGDYEAAPGVVANVYLHDGRLFVVMPGEGEAELVARSPAEFSIRVDPTVSIRFELPGGRASASAVRVTLRGREIVAKRKG